MRGAREALARGDTHRGGGGRRRTRPPAAAGAAAMERGAHGDGAQSSWLPFAPLARVVEPWAVSSGCCCSIRGSSGLCVTPSVRKKI